MLFAIKKLISVVMNTLNGEIWMHTLCANQHDVNSVTIANRLFMTDCYVLFKFLITSDSEVTKMRLVLCSIFHSEACGSNPVLFFYFKTFLLYYNVS